MKKRLKIIEDGIVKGYREINIPDKDHLQAQIKYPHQVVESKRKKALRRKQKYRVDYRKNPDGQL
jgi:hypothetical protein